MKSLHSSDHFPSVIPQHGRGDSDGDTLPRPADDMGGGVEDWFATCYRPSQYAGILTMFVRKTSQHCRPIASWRLALYCDVLRRPAEGCDPPLPIDSEDSRIIRIQYSFFPALGHLGFSRTVAAVCMSTIHERLHSARIGAFLDSVFGECLTWWNLISRGGTNACQRTLPLGAGFC